MARSPVIGVLGVENSNGHALLEVMAKALPDLTWVAYAPDPWAESFNPPRRVEVAQLSKVNDCDVLALLSEGYEDLARAALTKGVRVLDCTNSISSAFPVVAEINGGEIAKHSLLGCPTAEIVQAALVLAPLVSALPAVAVDIHALLPVVARDGTGPALLAGEAAKLLNGQTIEPTLFSHQIAFNLLPSIDPAGVDGLSRVEQLLTAQLPKILGIGKLPVNATCIQAPVFYALSESITVSMADHLSATQAKALLNQAPWLTVANRTDQPNAVEHGVESDQVSVGRIRQWGRQPSKIGCWSVMDYRYRGVGWNAVQIIQILIKSVL